MIQCDKCKGYIEELGELPIQENACRCSQNSLQQLKAEIATLANEVYQMSLLHPSEQSFSDIVDKMRQLSAV